MSRYVPKSFQRFKDPQVDKGWCGDVQCNNFYIQVVTHELTSKSVEKPKSKLTRMYFFGVTEIP